MQDKIKFYIENLRMDENILKSKFIKSSNISKNGNEVYKFNFHKSIFGKKTKKSEDIENQPTYFEDSKHENMYALFLRKEGEMFGKLIFNQNIRKNWINYSRTLIHEDEFCDKKYPTVMHDLKYSDFVEIIEVWAKELEIPRKIFWSAKITQIELGVNLIFDTKVKVENKYERVNLNEMISCFGTLNNVEEKYTYGKDGVCFKAQQFELSIYNKLKRAVHNNEIFSCDTEPKKRNMCTKINKVRYILRYELRIKCVSKFNQSAFSGKIETLQKMKDNWNLLLTALMNTTDNIVFYDFLSPEIEDDLLKAGLESKSKKIFENFLIYSGIKHIGYDTFLTHFLPLFNSNGRNKFSKLMYGNYQTFRDKAKYKNSYEKRFMNALDSKLKKLIAS